MTMRRLSKWTVPLTLGIVGGGCGGTVVQENVVGTGGAAGAGGVPAASTSVEAGGRTGASAGGSQSTPLGGGGGVLGEGGAGGVSLGDGGTGTGGASPGSGGAMPVVACGANVCTSPLSPLPGFALSPCCADAFTGTCGTISNLGGACTPPAQPDPRCPSVQTTVGSYSGCCTNNDCGVALSSVGCVDTTNPMFAMFLPGATPLHCDGTPFHAGTGGTGPGDAGDAKDASTPDGATADGGIAQ
jgi:hypothetical protein